MIYTRAELKSKAKSVLRSNRWKIILVSLILFLISGEVLSSVSNTESLASGAASGYNSGYSEVYDGDIDDFDIDAYADENITTGSPLLDGIIATVGIATVVVTLILASGLCVVLTVFVFNPLVVGIQRFFLVSYDEPAELGEMGFAFREDYFNNVKIMFWKDLKTFLWTLLLIIPGVIKSYEYRMIPYLLAENPDMSSKEAFDASRELMRGNKWRAFVLDLSFILWNLLNTVTLGLLGIFFLNPYRYLTNTAFYIAVCEEKQRD